MGSHFLDTSSSFSGFIFARKTIIETVNLNELDEANCQTIDNSGSQKWNLEIDSERGGSAKMSRKSPQMN